MANEYWIKQTKDNPAFPDMHWSKPENKLHAGKLLIIGGNAHNFSAPAQAFAEAQKAGIGATTVLLPDALKKTVGKVLENCEFAPSNKSGSFARPALNEWLTHAQWADGVLLAGDVGRNSETAIVLEEFVKHYSGPLAITQDCMDVFTGNPQPVFRRNKTLIVVPFGQLQKMWPQLVMDNHMIKYGHDLSENVQLLHEFSQKAPSYIITNHQKDLIVAAEGKVSTTPFAEEIWRVQAAAHAITWLIQNPTKPFQALSTAIAEISA